jgi:hypothetical protein
MIHNECNVILYSNIFFYTRHQIEYTPQMGILIKARNMG